MLAILNKLLGAKQERILYTRLKDDHVLDNDFPPTVMEPRDSYVQVRLCEMYLHKERELWVGYKPMGIVVSDFLYGNSRETVPYFVSDQILSSIEEFLDGQHVDFRNTRVAGPIPYQGDDMGIFVGLFRMKKENLADKLFNVLHGMVGSFDASVLTRYLDIARPLERGLSSLLGVTDMALRFGVRDVFNDRSNDTQQLRQGYLVYVNHPDEKITTDDLWIHEGRLFHGEHRDRIQLYSESDYCLVKIEHVPFRDDFIKLPFYSLWEDAKRMILAQQLNKAEYKRVEMIQQIAVSPDLAVNHREKLIMFFEGNYRKALKQHAELFETSPASPNRGVNRSGSEAADPGDALRNTVHAAKDAGFDKEVVQAIVDLSRSWEKMPDIELWENHSKAGEKTIVNLPDDLKKIGTSRKIKPEALADALTMPLA